MSTNFIYKDNDIANLTAKNCGETLSGVSYMNPSSQTDFKFDIESSKRYWFIPYSTSILGGLWAAKKVAYSSAFDSGSSNSTKIENAAAWGSAPIPKRWGLNNLNSPYIDSTKVEFNSGYKYSISWNTSTSCTELKKYNSSGSLVETTTMTKAPCLVIDVVAKGGDGGAGWKKTTLFIPWAGGGGGAASFIGVGGTGKSVLAVTSPGLGGGGGGGYGDVSRSNNGSCSTGSPGGSAGAIFYYESYTDRLYSTTAVTNRDSGSGPEIDSGDDDNPGSSGGSSGGTVGGGGCVFPGTQIYLNKDTSVDIVNFTGGTPIDFCNPDTLEHFQQQTLVSCFYKRATKKVIITLEDGKNLALTTNHAILTSEGFKTYFTTINNFPRYSIGDQVATVDGYKKISMIQEENINETTVYNIVTENSLMVANGIIVAGELNLNIDVTAISGPSVDKELGKP